MYLHSMCSMCNSRDDLQCAAHDTSSNRSNMSYNCATCIHALAASPSHNRPVFSAMHVIATSCRDICLLNPPPPTPPCQDPSRLLAYTVNVIPTRHYIHSKQQARRQPNALQVPPATLEVDVQPCGIGQIPTADGNQCISCPSSSYSFDPTIPDCKPCPFGATCMGGATLVPLQQYWHSAPDSDHIVTCPNSNACAGNTAALLSCQNASYEANLAVDQVGCAHHACMKDGDLWQCCITLCE